MKSTSPAGHQVVDFSLSGWHAEDWCDGGTALDRRRFVASAAAAIPIASLRAEMPKPYAWDLMPPLQSREAYVAWMRANRGEDAEFTRLRWDRYQVLVVN